ncbi:MAG TPA: HXXEE domain-containing protein [Vicinamibacterales bacterium]|nr:HXXEE domain-containing protein [Vicinamibacterales bacterium]
MRWHYRDAALLWLFPPAYLLHVAEELWGGPGFPQWLAMVAGQPLPYAAFAVINTIGMIVLIVGVRAAARHEASGWIAVAIATVATVNALLHIGGSLLTGTYSPGLITAVVLYVPLGQLLLIRALHQADRRGFARGIVVGVLIHAVVSAIALALARW